MIYPTKKLGEVCDLVTRGISPKYVENKGIVVLNQKCIRDHKVSYLDARLHDPANSVSQHKFVQIGDVLVNSTGVGTMGRVAQVKTLDLPTIVDSHITILRPAKGIFDTDYFGWAMIFVEHQIMQMGTGSSGQIELSRAALKELEIPVPPIGEQKRIVERIEKQFSKIDEVIRLREQSLAATESLLPATLHKIFEEGKKKGWDQSALGEICEIARGGSPRPIQAYLTNAAHGINWVKISDATSSTKYIYETKQKITKEGLKKTREVKPGDFILTNSMSFGRPYIMKTSGAIHDGWLLLRPKKELIEEYMYYFLSSDEIYAQFKQLAGGAVVQNLNSELVRNVNISIPPLAEQKAIVKKLDTLSSQIRQLQTLQATQLADLKALKQSILHEAFSGH